MITCQDYREFLGGLEAGSVDLVLTDPPYGISQPGVAWQQYTHGQRRARPVERDFGDWDKEATDPTEMAEAFARVLRPGGTAIVWYGMWHTGTLAEAMKAAGFPLIRLIAWEKTDPNPMNCKVNYLTTTFEMAVLGVKKGKPGTFNLGPGEKYHPGVYRQCSSRGKHHPTQKPVDLFETLVKRHSDPDDLVVDPFLGGGTTALAASGTGRRFKGCDINGDYVEIAKARTAGGTLL